MSNRNDSKLVRVSRFLSLVLRHQPEKIGIELDSQGWVDVDELIQNANRHGKQFSRETVVRVVAENDKQRFAISEDGQRIRANQGHSVKSVDLQLVPTQPPENLFHGTVSKFIASIKRDGLIQGSRNHVHLSPDLQTATRVGQRRGNPVILVIRAGTMHDAGYEFFCSANGVWLTERVPSEYIQFPEGC